MHGYDLELAVEARRVTLFEAHTFQECAELVWQPTGKLLKDLETSQPDRLVCLASPPARNFSFLDIVGPENKIAYIGLACNFSYARRVWMQKIKALGHSKELEEKREKLWRMGHLVISKNENGCLIPVNVNGLNRINLAQAFRTYLWTCAPKLADLPISWLAPELELALEKGMMRLAKERSKPATKEQIGDDIKQLFLKDTDLAY